VQLVNARFQGFRSIEDITLEKCGNLNIIIGKNNSGKSNILLALNSFFACLENGNPVSIEPPIGRLIDYFSGNTSTPIMLAVNFRLTLSDVEEIYGSIIETAPQMRNAADALKSEQLLSVSIMSPYSDTRFSCVREIKLLTQAVPGVRPQMEHLLLRVPPTAARELASSAAAARAKEDEARSLRNAIESVRRFPTENWERVKREFLNEHMMYSFSAEGAMTPAIFARIQEIGTRTETLREFQEQLLLISKSTDNEAGALRNRPLSTNVDTFAGNEDRLPQYALLILKKIAGIKVLYLTERREPIGGREATLLLDLKVSRGGSVNVP
jgi:putative ATP-dependent endonuclease of OLD family